MRSRSRSCRELPLAPGPPAARRRAVDVRHPGGQKGFGAARANDRLTAGDSRLPFPALVGDRFPFSALPAENLPPSREVVEKDPASHAHVHRLDCCSRCQRQRGPGGRCAEDRSSPRGAHPKNWLNHAGLRRTASGGAGLRHAGARDVWGRASGGRYSRGRTRGPKRVINQGTCPKQSPCVLLGKILAPFQHHPQLTPTLTFVRTVAHAARPFSLGHRA